MNPKDCLEEEETSSISLRKSFCVRRFWLTRFSSELKAACISRKAWISSLMTLVLFSKKRNSEEFAASSLLSCHGLVQSPEFLFFGFTAGETGEHVGEEVGSNVVAGVAGLKVAEEAGGFLEFLLS